MKIVIHAGAHFTDAEKLLKSLLGNRDLLAASGVAVPGPGKYREILRRAVSALGQNAPGPGALAVLLDTILDDAQADRMILSNQHFFGVRAAALEDDLFYPYATEKLVRMVRLFAPSQVELFFAVRDPASFVPILSAKLPEKHRERVVSETRPGALRWSSLIAQLRTRLPQVPITVWCHEDAPMLWGRIMREVAGLPPGARIAGAFDMVGDLMTPEGMKRLRACFRKHPQMSGNQRRRAIALHLERFARPGALEEELEMPGWTQETLADLSVRYEADLQSIAAMQGVRLLSPWTS